jgi:AmpE protein
MTFALALVGDFDTVVGAWKDNGGASLQMDAAFLAAAGRASVRTELADEAMDYADDGVTVPGVLVAAMGDLPELRDAMSLVWRVMLLWLAVLAVFVVAGFVN